jgi:hypothetical protein
MSTGQIVARVRAEHDALRRVLATVEAFSRRTRENDPEALAPLRKHGLELHARLCRHLDLEERKLLPAVESEGEWGSALARRVRREHGEQRLLLRFILSPALRAGSALLRERSPRSRFEGFEVPLAALRAAAAAAGGRLNDAFLAALAGGWRRFGPTAGTAANVTLFHFREHAWIGLNVDPAAVPDPGRLAECMQEGFEEVLKLGEGGGTLEPGARHASRNRIVRARRTAFEEAR